MRAALIGLVGHARHGKNTVAKFIAGAARGKRTVEMAFADAVREECRDIYGWNGVKDEAGRTLLQEHGMKRRRLDPDYWLKKTFERLDECPADIVVITDVRFRNEADEVVARGGELWRVVRFDDNGDIFDGGMTPEQRGHPSETELDGYSCRVCITNTSLASLRRGVRRALRFSGVGKVGSCG